MAGNDYASQSRLSDLHGWYIYIVYELDGLYSKIGTAATVQYRLSGLQNGNPRKLVLFKSWRVASRSDAFKVERAALARAEPKRVPNRDWVLLSHFVAAELVEAAAVELNIPMKEVEAK
jgi:hypothetical protein